MNPGGSAGVFASGGFPCGHHHLCRRSPQAVLGTPALVASGSTSPFVRAFVHRPANRTPVRCCCLPVGLGIGPPETQLEAWIAPFFLELSIRFRALRVKFGTREGSESTQVGASQGFSGKTGRVSGAIPALWACCASPPHGGRAAGTARQGCAGRASDICGRIRTWDSPLGKRGRSGRIRTSTVRSGTGLSWSWRRACRDACRGVPRAHHPEGGRAGRSGAHAARTARSEGPVAGAACVTQAAGHARFAAAGVGSQDGRPPRGGAVLPGSVAREMSLRPRPCATPERA